MKIATTLGVMAISATLVYGHPAINAGDSQGVIDDWNMVINLIGPNTKIVPGVRRAGERGEGGPLVIRDQRSAICSQQFVMKI